MSVYRFEGDSLEEERLVSVCISDGKVKPLNLSIRQMETVQCGVLSWPVSAMAYKSSFFLEVFKGS